VPEEKKQVPWARHTQLLGT